MTKEETAALLVSDVKKDLHIHTYYSDGALSPKEVVDIWSDNGYELISITDHDGIEGSKIIRDYAVEKGIGFIPGVEFDSADELGKDIHMLGYGFDYDNPVLVDALDGIILEREIRNHKMMLALNDLGYSFTLDDVLRINDGRYVGKPTFALILAQKGYTSCQQEAFGTIFREPQIRKIRKNTLGTKEVIDIIHAAGGLAVLAHPMEQRHLDETYNQFRERLFPILDKMRAYGIDGIECYHPSADDVQSEVLRDYANRYDLLITKGSDYHSEYHKRDFSRYHRP